MSRTRRRRFRQGDVNQLLHDVDRSSEVDMQSSQQSDAEQRLNDCDRGERKSALPRSHYPPMLGVSGHWRARLSLSDNSSADEPSTNGRSHALPLRRRRRRQSRRSVRR